MNRLLQLCVLLLAIAGTTSYAQSPSKKFISKRSAESEVRKAFDAYYQAFNAGDVETVKRMSRDDYLQTDVYGNVQDKATWLAEYYLPLAERIKSGGLKLDTFKSSELQIRLYGNVAVIVGRTTLNNPVVSGQAQTRGLRFTQVWVKSHGQWQRGVYHNAFVPEPISAPASKE
jgi:ketosteroid isomerase-like protein